MKMPNTLGSVSILPFCQAMGHDLYTGQEHKAKISQYYLFCVE